MDKTADTQYPIHNALATRWSPYCFATTDVAPADLTALFEAARWAPSSYNEQPWRFIVGRREHDTVHARILNCLVEANQRWAAEAPVLALGMTVGVFERNGKPNRAAQHDLGLAVGNLLVEATVRGLHVHQMSGLDTQAAAREFAVPDEAEVITALAIGHLDTGADRDPELAERDTGTRNRRALSTFVFGARYGTSADL